MPRRRAPARAYRGDGEEPNGSSMAKYRWWLKRFTAQLESGDLVLRVQRRALCMMAASEAIGRWRKERGGYATTT